MKDSPYVNVTMVLIDKGRVDKLHDVTRAPDTVSFKTLLFRPWKFIKATRQGIVRPINQQTLKSVFISHDHEKVNTRLEPEDTFPFLSFFNMRGCRSGLPTKDLNLPWQHAIIQMKNWTQNTRLWCTFLVGLCLLTYRVWLNDTFVLGLRN